MNTARKGANKERSIVNVARAKGFYAFRAACSKSSTADIDVCVIDYKNKIINFIQCKPASWSENKRKQLQDKHPELNGEGWITEYIVV
jgi:Holliday junction resolvase